MEEKDEKRVTSTRTGDRKGTMRKERGKGKDPMVLGNGKEGEVRKRRKRKLVGLCQRERGKEEQVKEKNEVGKGREI